MGGRGLGLWGTASRPCGRGLELSVKRQQYRQYTSTTGLHETRLSSVWGSRYLWLSFVKLHHSHLTRDTPTTNTKFEFSTIFYS